MTTTHGLSGRIWRKRALKIIYRHIEIQLGKIIGNPFAVFTLAFAAYGIAKMVQEITATFGMVVVPFSVLIFAILVYFHFRDEIDVLPPETINRAAGYRIYVPSDLVDATVYNDVKQIIDESQKIFGSAAVDPLQDIGAWRNDPFSMVILKSGEKVLGFLDFYFFERQDFERFLSGEAEFDDIHANCVLPHPQARTAKIAYIGTVVHFEFCSVARRENQYRSEVYMIVAAALEAILKYQDFGDDGIDFFASAWSKEGRQMLERFGFREETSYVKRGFFDSQLLTRRNVTKSEVEAIYRGFANQKAAVNMEL